MDKPGLSMPLPAVSAAFSSGEGSSFADGSQVTGPCLVSLSSRTVLRRPAGAAPPEYLSPGIGAAGNTMFPLP